jgi:hypothetical protein
MTGSRVDPVGGQSLPPKYISTIERANLLPYHHIPTVHVRGVVATDKKTERDLLCEDY